MILKFIFLSGFLFCLTGLLSCEDRIEDDSQELQTEQQFTPLIKIKLEGYPDSVVRVGERMFVSCKDRNMPFPDKKGKGFIVELDQSGKVINPDVFPDIPLTSPRGMAAIEDVLYVTDINRIIGIHTITGQMVFELALKMDSSQSLMDIVSTEEGLLYTAWANEQDIYIIDPEKPPEQSFLCLRMSQAIPGIHGLTMEGNILYVSGSDSDEEGRSTGRLWGINLDNGKVTSLSEETGHFDGIAVLDGDLYFSDWDRGQHGEFQHGAVRKMNLESGEITDVTRIPLKGVADFYIDPDTRTIWIPAMVDKTVIIAPL